jgi:hypothetical protein
MIIIFNDMITTIALKPDTYNKLLIIKRKLNLRNFNDVVLLCIKNMRRCKNGKERTTKQMGKSRTKRT